MFKQVENMTKPPKKTFLTHLFITALFITTLNYSINSSANTSTSLPFNTEASMNLIHQHSSESKIKSETTLSIDINLEYELTDKDLIVFHIEASSTPQKNGVSSMILDSNADSASAVDDSDNGRIQVSQLFYQTEFSNNKQFTIGLVDATSFSDSSLIANDEGQQFITPSLVNNPVIDFPDYVIGLAYQADFAEHLSAVVFLSSTHGLADNQSRNYSNLFEVQKDEKGIFSATEIQYSNPNWLINGGAWLHNGNHEALDDTTKVDLSNYGIYTNINRILGNHTLGLRTGLANPKVSVASEFISLAYQYSSNNSVLGLGYSNLITSSFNQDNSLKNNQEMIELYTNYAINKNLSFTPAVQMYKNPQIDTTLINNAPDELYNFSLRLFYLF